MAASPFSAAAAGDGVALDVARTHTVLLTEPDLGLDLPSGSVLMIAASEPPIPADRIGWGQVQDVDGQWPARRGFLRSSYRRLARIRPCQSRTHWPATRGSAR